LSIIRLANYSITTSLIHIQVRIIGDAQDFSSIVSIILSGGFSSETLIGVGLCHRRPNQIGISLSWKTGYLVYYITTTVVCCKKE